jgi:predicted nucleic acid-binding protein
MSQVEAARPLFIDTGAFFARFNERDEHHEWAVAIFEAIADGNLPYRPLYTSGYVLSELATLSQRKAGHSEAVEVLNRAAESPHIRVIHPAASAFDATREEFERYDDQGITFVDHLSAVLARERDVSHVFTFDGRDFRKFDAGFTLVPDDVEVPQHD